MSGHVGLACLCLLALSVASSRQQDATELPSEKNVTAEQVQTILELTRRNSELQARLDAADQELTALRSRSPEVNDLQEPQGSDLTGVQQILEAIEYARKNATIAALGMVVLNKQFYHFEKQALDWHDAQTYCRSLGLQLSDIENFPVNREVVDHKNDIGLRDVWLGGSDEAEEGTWRWVASGHVLNYTAWEWGDLPPSDKEKNCVEMTREGRWKAAKCALKQSFVCKMFN